MNLFIVKVTCNSLKVNIFDGKYNKYIQWKAAMNMSGEMLHNHIHEFACLSKPDLYQQVLKKKTKKNKHYWMSKYSSFKSK